MRLTCPNCGAQYEVPDAVIPAAGRDVQCSNCGDTWFQAHPGQAEATEAAPTTPSAPATPPASETPAPHVTPRRPRPGEATAPQAAPEPAAEDRAPEPAVEPEVEVEPAPFPEAAAFESTDAYSEAEPAPPATEDSHDTDPGDGPMGWPAPEHDPSEPPRPQDMSAEDAPVEAEPAPLPPAPDEPVDIPDPESPRRSLSDGRNAPPPATREDYDDYDDQAGPAPSELLARRRRRELDPAVRDVLREEALHEAQARAKSAGGLESQPDLGLGEPESESDRREREARARMARLRGKPVPETSPESPGDDTETQASSSRRDLLPDIEEINSSLRSRNQKVEAEDPYVEEDPAARRSFRLGFTLPIFIAAMGVLVYVNAPRIAAQIPQAAPAMRAYVGGIDDGRRWLDSNVRDLITWIETQTGSDA